MSDSRKRRGAKPNRRAYRRRQANTEDDMLITAISKALAKHPLHLLDVASYLISRCATEDERSLENVIANLTRIRRRETTALLVVLAEMLEDDLLRDRCHQEVATRNHYLPKWIVGLPHVEVRRVMRRTDVLGDGDELAIGVRLVGGTELTLGAFLDHNFLSAATDLTLLPHPLDGAIAQGRERADSETTFVDMEPADARAWIENGLRWVDPFVQQNGWRERLPLMKWLLAQLPGGGGAYEGPEWDEGAIAELLDGFFGSAASAPFADVGYRDMLMELCETGCGDPLRWSVYRVASILRDPFRNHYVPLEIEVDAPALLRAFIPFAHARSGIGQDLTEDAITKIDELALRYKRTLLEEATEYHDEDEPPWRNQAS